VVPIPHPSRVSVSPLLKKALPNMTQNPSSLRAMKKNSFLKKKKKRGKKMALI
jgi:hypothetical protein